MQNQQLDPAPVPLLWTGALRVWDEPGGEAHAFRNATIGAGGKADDHSDLTAAETPETTKHLSDASLSPDDKDATAEFGGYLQVGDSDGYVMGDDTTLEEMTRSAPRSDLDAPDEPGRFVILTSGTTGSPKGAQRGSPEGLGPLAALLSKIPYRARETLVIAAPLFHSWGFTHFVLGLPLASTVVMLSSSTDHVTTTSGTGCPRSLVGLAVSCTVSPIL